MTLTQKIARASIATILLVSTVSALSETAAAQNPVPVIAITLLPSERVAPITASQQAAVTFTGNYTVDKLNIERAQVSFTAVVTTGWVATVSPASITVTLLSETRRNSFGRPTLTCTSLKRVGSIVKDCLDITMIHCAVESSSRFFTVTLIWSRTLPSL